MARFSQDVSRSKIQQWSQNYLWTLWSQSQFKLHGPLLGSRNFNKFQLFADEDVELIGSIDVSIKREIEDTSWKEDDIGKKKNGRAVPTK